MEIVLRKELKQLISNLNLDDNAILFLIACKLGLDTSIDDYVFSILATNKIIERDFIKGGYIVKIPVFEGESGDIPIPVSAELIRNIIDRIDEFRVLFRGIRVRSMGDRKTVEENMIRWLTLNPDISFDDVINITAEYLSNADRTYIPSADNFIFSIKNGKEVSTLSAIVEESKFNFNKKF